MLQSTCFGTKIETGVDYKDDSGSKYREQRRGVKGKMTLTVARRSRPSGSKVISQPQSLGGRRPVDRAAGTAQRSINLTHVRVYSRATQNDFFLLSSIQRSDEDWRSLAFISLRSLRLTKIVLKPKNKGHASALPASVAGSSYLSSSKVKNKDRWTTNGILRAVSIEQTERASSRKTWKRGPFSLSRSWYSTLTDVPTSIVLSITRNQICKIGWTTYNSWLAFWQSF